LATRQEQKAFRRQEILAAALELFITKGYAETKVADIAERVGMSSGLMFHYFDSKAKLLEELVLIGATGPAMMLEFDASDPLAYFETVAVSILGALEDDPFVAQMFVLMAQVGFSVKLPEPIREMVGFANILDKTMGIIAAGQTAGQLRPGDPQALAILFWQALSGVAEYKAFNPEAPLPKSEWIIDCLRREQK
jgi:AcrR family transcriptional regulator